MVKSDMDEEKINQDKENRVGRIGCNLNWVTATDFTEKMTFD